MIGLFLLPTEIELAITTTMLIVLLGILFLSEADR